MTSINEALTIAKDKNTEAKIKRENKMRTKPITAIGLQQIFVREFKKIYGTPPIIKKDTTNKLRSFIRVAKSSDIEDGDLLQLMKDIVLNWSKVQGKEFQTMKNHKQFLISDRPSLAEFLVCRESILPHLQSIEIEIPDTEEDSGIPYTTVITTKRRVVIEEEYR